MKIRSFSYFLEESLKNTFRNGLMSITSVITVSACVFMVILLCCVVLNVDHALEQLESSTGTMKVYITDEATNEQVSALYAKLTEIEYVDTVEFKNSQQAMEDFIAQYGGDEKLFEGLDKKNILRRRFIITLSSARYQDVVISRLNTIKDEDGIVSSVFNIKTVTDTLTAVDTVIRVVCVIIILVLSVLSVVIIVNTIKLAVNARRSEIGIMKFVGATDWFIKWPFILEGLFIGVVGAFVPILFFGISYEWMTDSVASFFINAINMKVSLKPGFEIFSMVIPVSIVFGGLIGTLGSFFSVRRYLNV